MAKTETAHHAKQRHYGEKGSAEEHPIKHKGAERADAKKLKAKSKKGRMAGEKD